MTREKHTARPSVLLIREWETQMSSSGCCGRLEGDFLSRGDERCFPERRARMEAMGPLYLALRAEFGEHVDVHVVDPRSLPTLLGLLLRDWRAHGVGAGDALRTLFGLPVSGVIVNGRLVAKGRWPDLDELRPALEGPAAMATEAVGGVA
jgi:hypothetical protein